MAHSGGGGEPFFDLSLRGGEKIFDTPARGGEEIFSGVSQSLRQMSRRGYRGSTSLLLAFLN